MWDIIILIGQVGGIGAVVYALFQWLGKKYLEEYFAKRIAAFNHEAAREIERLRLELNTTFSRVAKLHEREFDILPKLWEKLGEADNALRRCTISFQSIPDLDSLDTSALEEFLAGTSLLESEKNLVRSSKTKVEQFGKISDWHDIQEARNAFIAYQSYLRLNRVFIQRDLATKLDALASLMWTYWIAVHMEKRKPGSASDGYFRYDDPSKALIAEIEKLIHGRLYPA